MSILLRFLPTKLLIKRYETAGAIFGDSLSYIYMGECIEFRWRLRKLIRLEKEIARRGFIPHSLDDFVGYGGFEKPLPELEKVAPGDLVPPLMEAALWAEENSSEIPAIVPWREWFGRNKKKD